MLFECRTNGMSYIYKYYTNTVRWRDHIRLMLQMMPPLLSLSLLVTSSSPTPTALTDAMSESVPFFFCSDFREEIFVDLNWKRFLAAARFEPSTFQSNTWQIRPQVLITLVLLYYLVLVLWLDTKCSAIHLANNWASLQLFLSQIGLHIKWGYLNCCYPTKIKIKFLWISVRCMNVTSLAFHVTNNKSFYLWFAPYHMFIWRV